MSNEEAIKRLKEARGTIQPFRYIDEAIDYAVKALEPKTDTWSIKEVADVLEKHGLIREQQPILDKIRAEIFNACSDKYHMPVHKLSCEEIFEIIDRYKAE